MSFTYGFYNSVNHDRVYDAQQWSSIFDGLIADGIYETQGDKFIVSATDPASMVVTVGTGRAWFHHTWSLNDSLLPITIDPSDLVLDRIDVICLEVNTSNDVRANAIKVLKGIPDENPVAPTLTHSEYVNQYALAEITIAAGASSIAQSAITNKVGTTGTPFVIGVVEVMDASELYAQWSGEWEEFKDYIRDNEEEIDEWVAGFGRVAQAEFYTWFRNLQNQLDSNQAAHLQHEIDDLNEREFNHYYGLAAQTTTFERDEDYVTRITSTNAESTSVTTITRESDGNIVGIVTVITPTTGPFIYRRQVTISQNSINAVITSYEREVAP